MAFGYRRRAFRYIFARTLAKDAAPIPNAEGWKWCFFTIDFCDSHKAMPYVIYVSPFQGSILYFLQKKVNILWFFQKNTILAISNGM